MGGRSYSASLYFGPVEQLPVCAWMYIFGILSDEKLIDKVKTSSEYLTDLQLDKVPKHLNEGSDEYDPYSDFLEDLIEHYGDEHIHDYYQEFTKFLKDNNLDMVADCNFNEETFFIGRVIKDIKEDTSKDIEFWNKYQAKYHLTLDVFAAIQGRLDFSCHFARPGTGWAM